jgi:hypothetical protein
MLKGRGHMANYTLEEDTRDTDKGGNKLDEAEASQGDRNTNKTISETKSGLLDFLGIAVATDVFVGGDEDVDQEDEADEEEDEVDDIDRVESEKAGDGGGNGDIGGDTVLNIGSKVAEFDSEKMVHKMIINRVIVEY